jgi:hypothetical protein
MRKIDGDSREGIGVRGNGQRLDGAVAWFIEKRLGRQSVGEGEWDAQRRVNRPHDSQTLRFFTCIADAPAERDRGIVHPLFRRTDRQGELRARHGINMSD